MQLRCYHCGMSFAIKREVIAFALKGLEESGGKHYDAHCPRCRHANKVSIDQLRRVAPPAEKGETEDAA